MNMAESNDFVPLREISPSQLLNESALLYSREIKDMRIRRKSIEDLIFIVTHPC
jgi:hypothetical protein